MSDKKKAPRAGGAGADSAEAESLDRPYYSTATRNLQAQPDLANFSEAKRLADSLIGFIPLPNIGLDLLQGILAQYQDIYVYGCSDREREALDAYIKSRIEAEIPADKRANADVIFFGEVQPEHHYSDLQDFATAFGVELPEGSQNGRLIWPDGPPHATDMGNAQRLAALHGADLRYCEAWGRWLVWDKTRWRPLERTAGPVVTMAKETVRAMYAEAADLDDDKERKALAKWAVQSETRTRLESMVALARSEPGIPVDADQLDTDPWHLNVLNGTIDLKTGEMLMHSRERLITKIAPVEYKPYASAPTWEAFLDRVMNGNQELIKFLKRGVGYSLTGNTSEQCLFMLYGTGANGKTTLIQAIGELLGDYAHQTPTETLLTKRAGAIPNDVARLRGARLVTAIEAEEGRRMAEALVKQVTGGDKVAARFLHQEYFEFTPAFKIWLGTNHKPTIRGTDHAIWRRIRLIPFTVTIPEAERDPNMLHRLTDELPGILAWAVEGCLEWQIDGLGAPAEVLEATEEYRAEMDVLGEFIEDRCELSPTGQGQATDLYIAYTVWCEGSGEKALTKTAFGRRLTERGFDKYRDGRKGIVYIGIQLAATDKASELVDEL